MAWSSIKRCGRTSPAVLFFMLYSFIEEWPSVRADSASPKEKKCIGTFRNQIFYAHRTGIWTRLSHSTAMEKIIFKKPHGGLVEIYFMHFLSCSCKIFKCCSFSFIIVLKNQPLQMYIVLSLYELRLRAESRIIEYWGKVFLSPLSEYHRQTGPWYSLNGDKVLYLNIHLYMVRP